MHQDRKARASAQRLCSRAPGTPVVSGGKLRAGATTDQPTVEGSAPMGQWAVADLEPNDRGNLAAGFVKVVLEQESEADARQVFADKVGVAESLDYAGVQLRCDGSVIDRWPVVIGDGPDVSDFR